MYWHVSFQSHYLLCIKTCSAWFPFINKLGGIFMLIFIYLLMHQSQQLLIDLVDLIRLRFLMRILRISLLKFCKMMKIEDAKCVYLLGSRNWCIKFSFWSDITIIGYLCDVYLHVFSDWAAWDSWVWDRHFHHYFTCLRCQSFISGNKQVGCSSM